PIMFIAVDGIDGAGKSTLVRGLARALQSMHPVLTKEPTGDSEWGKKLRNAAVHGRLPRDIETQYFHFDRLAHLENFVRPALAANKLVITDRYVDSTLAFQTDTPEQADDLYVRFLPEILIPDLTFILDCSVSVGLRRIKEGRPSFSAFEKKNVLERARKIYASRRGPNYVHIDATKTPHDVLRAALDTLVSRFQCEN